MNKSKSTKGITLVALIITIIVLLILAVVAIGTVNNTGIIQYAQNSTDEYTKGRDKENGILQGYMDYLNENDPNKVKQSTWDYAWICTEETVEGETKSVWQDTVYTSESDLPDDYIIIAKFYEQTDKEKINYVDRGEEVLPDDYPYKLVIELKEGVTGPKEMGPLGDPGEEYWGWTFEEIKAIEGDEEATGIAAMAYVTEVIIGEGISNIGDCVFTYAVNLKELIIPSGVTTIGEAAFQLSSSLTELTIPTSVETIGEGAFSYCVSLGVIKYAGLEADWNDIIMDEYGFYYLPEGAKVVFSDGTEKVLERGD